ncbi:MAG: hypothetical protein ACJAS9_002462 [Polaribacter sp.]|jgi:hypothetical protein
MLVSVIKEILESLLRNLRRIPVRSKKYVRDIISALNLDGISIEENFYTQDQCADYRQRIDAMIASGSSNVWCDEQGSDQRIYFINEVDELFQDFYQHPKVRDVLAAYVGTTEPKGMLLAARIEYVENNLGSGGGWHRDSPFTHQFKAICYLNDVTSENGPFQYIKQSHRKFKVLKNYFNKTFKPGQYRFSDKDIEGFLNSNPELHITDNVAKAGTLVFADTKGIHRGKPLSSGTRYVLFCYFWHNTIPPHFEALKQK